jgi:hypothetical protein
LCVFPQWWDAYQISCNRFLESFWCVTHCTFVNFLNHFQVELKTAVVHGRLVWSTAATMKWTKWWSWKWIDK